MKKVVWSFHGEIQTSATHKRLAVCRNRRGSVCNRADDTKCNLLRREGAPIFSKKKIGASFVPLAPTWQGQKGSNPRHAVLETAALPAELYPYTAFLFLTRLVFLLVGLRGLEPGTDRL